MAILLKNVSTPVLNLIYEKQKELKIKKGRNVSLEQTVDTLLKDAYIGKTKAS
jgi:hypothetical protein